MLFKLTLLIAVFFSCAGVIASEQEECGPAVEEADRLAASRECDYSNTGLNGVLHRAFSGQDKSSANHEDKNINPAREPKGDVGPATITARKNQIGVDKLDVQQSDEFASVQQLQTTKFLLLQTLALECPKGFVVEGERYLLIKNSKAIKLELIHHCL